MGANCCKTEAQEEKLTQDKASEKNEQQEKSLVRPVDSMHTLSIKIFIFQFSSYIGSQRHNHHNLSKASDTSSMYYSCAGDDDKKRFFAAYHQEEGGHGNPYESRSRFSTFARKGLPESSLDAQVFDGTHYRDRQENEISIGKLGNSEGVSMTRNAELEKEAFAPAPYNDQFLQHPDLHQDAGDSDDDEFFEPKSHMSETLTMGESRFSERPKDFDAQTEQADENNEVPVDDENNDKKSFAAEEIINENKLVSPRLEINIVKEENLQNAQPEDIDTCDPKAFPTENFDEVNADQQDGEAFLSQDSENPAEITEASESQNIVESEQNKVEIAA